MVVNTRPTISVVIPTYNSSSTLRRTLESLYNQVEGADEIIIVDDCSSSEELKSLALLVDEFSKFGLIIKLHCNPFKSNASVTRNIGMLSSSCDLIAFLDADDFFSHDKIKVYLDYFEENSHVGLVFSDITSSIDFLGKRSDCVTYAGGDMSEYLFLHGGLAQTSTIAIRRKLSERLLFNHNLLRHQDYDFIIRASKVCKIDKINRYLTFYEEPMFGSKKESYLFSYWWASSNRNLFSKKGYAAFHLMNLFARAIIGGYFFSAMFHFVYGFLNAGRFGRKTFLTKLLNRLRSIDSTY